VFAGVGKTDLHLSVSSRRPRRVPLSLEPHRPVPLFEPYGRFSGPANGCGLRRRGPWRHSSRAFARIVFEPGVRSPVEICFGTRPSQAAKSRPVPRIVAERLELAAQMMRADARFHADETGWQCREPGLDLSA
jgi:hypothetical protein